MRLIGKFVIGVAMLATVQQLAAESALPVIAEFEPNNEPKTALSFAAPAILSGNLSEGDQDGYLWRISDADAQKLWDFRLHGMPNALTGASIVRVIYGPDPNTPDTSKEDVVIGYEKLLTFGIRDGSRPVSRKNIFLPEGELLVGLFGTGQSSGFRPPNVKAIGSSLDQLDIEKTDASEPPTLSAYRLSINSQVSPNIKTRVSNETKEKAAKLRVEQAFTTLANGESWYAIELNEQQAESRWTVSGQVMIEHASEIELIGLDGSEITNTKTDKYGHYSLPNLVLNTGKYYVRITNKEQTPSPRGIRVHASGNITDTSEQEPNDKWALANLMTFDDVYTGSVDKKGENDFYRFAVTGIDQDEVFDLVLDSPGLDTVEFCILSDTGVSRACKSGKPPLTFDSLNLNEGEHGLKVSRGSAQSNYSITKTVKGVVTVGQEIEPNNIIKDASVFGPKNLLKGTLPKGDLDYFTLNVTTEPQLWRIQAIGKNLRDLTYHPNDGDSKISVRASTNSRRVRLDNLYLLPGTHQFSLGAGSDTKYVLRALPLGQPGPYSEWESNSKRERAQDIKLDGRVDGLITEKTDADYYRFHIPGQQFIKLSFKPPPQSKFRLAVYWDGGFLKEYRGISSESPLDEVLNLHSGDYYLYLTASEPSEVEYKLEVSRATDPQVADIEPNDNPPTASAIPITSILEGEVGNSHAAADLYRIPASASDRKMTMSGEIDPNVRLSLVDVNQRKLGDIEILEEGRWASVIPGGKEALLKIVNGYDTGNYRLKLSLDGQAVPALEASELPVSISFSSSGRKVAAYREEYQSLNLEALIENTTSETLKLDLQVSSDNDKWKASIAPKVEIPGNQNQSLQIRVDVKPDAWPDQAVKLEILARDSNNRQASQNIELTAERFHELVNGRYDIPLPRALQGSINVASKALGGEMVTEGVRNIDYLHDGVTALGQYFMTKRSTPLSPGEVQAIIDLAGENAVDVVGFSFHPFGLQDGQPAQRNATKVTVELSMDGVNFQTAIEAELLPQTVEQSFALEENIKAKYARLTLLKSLDPIHIALGEWKVLASPSSVATELKHNIALPELGGHVVWTNPTLPTYSHVVPLLTSKNDAQAFRARKGSKYEWVIGFSHNRAALVESLSWRDKPNIGENRFYETDIFASLESPVGPWKKIATWQLTDQEQKSFTLPNNTWARFLRFEARTNQSGGSSSYLPDQIEVMESLDHGSIIGEWGQNNSNGPYEKTVPPLAVNLSGPVQHTRKESAKSLKNNQVQHSHVRLGDYDNWYQVIIPANQNSLTIELEGAPSIGAVAELENENGENLEWHSVEEDVKKTIYSAMVGPGSYFIKVVEPPRSVVFTWDTSGSTGQVRPIIRQALMEYIEGVKPGLDEAQMLPFGGSFLSRRWLDQPYLLQSILNDYNGAGNSSAAETALVKAAEKLRNRKGKKIIVLITDAATSKDRALWQTLSEVRPRIIALGVSSVGAFSSKPKREQDLLQDWAASSNGYYEYVENVGAVARAYDRASSRIRQPAEYTITAKTEFLENPKPGYLKIDLTQNSSSEIQLSRPVIEVILDASGSMYKKLGNKRRYQVAREVLTDLIKNDLPDNVDFGLRAFGHKEVGSCRTDLEIPIGPLNRSQALQKLKSITPQSLAKTPIAASLDAIAQDMKSSGENSTVIVITDGEETCNGDVAKSIAALQLKGVDAVINIVGFAIDDEVLEAKFRQWATLGGGDYKSAADQDLLNKSIQNLTSLSFTVTDVDGKTYGPYYSDDGAVELEAGEYMIGFQNGAKHSVRIQAEQTTSLGVGYE